MKVHDGDLEFMVDVMRGHAEASDCDHSRELSEKVVAELLALRKVADAALLLEDAMRDIPCPCRGKACEVMCRALREAGR